MKPTEEALMAYADGELAEDQAAQVAAAIAADPQLAARVEAHRRLRRQLSAAYDPRLAQPVPLRLQAAAARLARAQRDAAAAPSPSDRRWGWQQWGAMAASLVVGVLLAQGLPMADVPGAIASREGHLVAHGELARGLDRQPSGAALSGLDVRMSFMDADGQACRVFVTSGDASLAGLACRHGKGWRLPVLMQAPAAVDQAMRQAASPLPSALLDAVDARIVGEPFDAVAEDAAIRAEWRGGDTTSRQ